MTNLCNDDIVADFTELFTSEVEEKPVIDVSELIPETGFKNKVLGWWNNKPIFYQKEQFIVVLGSHKQLLIINTNFDDIEKHSHLRIKTNANGEISLSTAAYVIDCILKFTYPKSSYTWTCAVRLADDEEYLEYLTRKRKKTKDKQKYYNAPNNSRR